MASVEAKLDELASLRSVGGDGMDVLFVLNNLGVGGSEKKVVRLANTLSTRGMRVGVAYLNQPSTLLKDISENVARFFLSREGRFSLKAHAALTGLIEAQRPRNVVSVNLYPALYVVTATRGARHRPRIIGLMNTTEIRRGARWKRGFYMRVLRYLDWTVYGCELQRDAWLSADSPMRACSSVIYNGVDLNRFTAARVTTGLRAEYGISETAFVVGSVGRLVAEKNQMPLVDAVADLRASGADVHLMLVGDGPLRSALEQRAAERDIAGAVTFTGAMPDVRAALKAFDVFVLPSLSETFSNAALEAMAMQLPVILTRTGGASEMIEHGTEGYIVDVVDLPQQLPALLDQLRLDNVMRTRMATAASMRAQREFSWDGMLEAYQAVFGAREAVSHA